MNADVLSVEPARSSTAPYTVVANLPYHITSPALRHLLGAGPPFAQRLVVMVQAEVAERISARPGELSSLAVTIQAQAAVRLRAPRASRGVLPSTQSGLGGARARTAQRRREARSRREEVRDFTTLVQAGFKQPRKTLANSLSDGLAVTRSGSD